MNYQHIKIREDDTSFLQAYLLSPEITTGVSVKRPAIIILPGGSYLHKSYREGEPVAAQFSALGYQSFVFSYPTLWKKKYTPEDTDIELNPPAPYPEQVYDLYKVIALVRKNADAWGIDPHKIFLLGFSAGGHVAASAAVNWQNSAYLEAAGIKNPEDAKPDACVLGYPMVDAELIRERACDPLIEKVPALKFIATYLPQSVFGVDKDHITEDMWREMDLSSRITPETPPFFIWHTDEDRVTRALDTTRFVEALIKNGVTCEYHLFETGPHGMSLCTPAVAKTPDGYNLNNAVWPLLADLFLKRR